MAKKTLLSISYENGVTTSRYIHYPFLYRRLSKPHALTIRKLVNKLPRSWYVDKDLKVHTPYWRRLPESIRRRSLFLLDLLDGSNCHGVITEFKGKAEDPIGRISNG